MDNVQRRTPANLPAKIEPRRRVRTGTTAAGQQLVLACAGLVRERRQVCLRAALDAAEADTKPAAAAAG